MIKINSDYLSGELKGAMCVGTQGWPVQPEMMPESGTNLLSNMKKIKPIELVASKWNSF